MHNHALENGEFLHGGDVIQAQMVAAADIGHHGDIATVKRQTFAQHATACSFQHGGIDIGVQKNATGAARAAAIAGVDAGIADINAIGIRHAHAQPFLG